MDESDQKLPFEMIVCFMKSAVTTVVMSRPRRQHAAVDVVLSAPEPSRPTVKGEGVVVVVVVVQLPSTIAVVTSTQLGRLGCVAPRPLHGVSTPRIRYKLLGFDVTGTT